MINFSRKYKESLVQNHLTKSQIIIFILACIVLSRLVLYLAFIFSSIAMNKPLDIYSFFTNGLNHELFCDCTWYKSILEYGYGETPYSRKIASGAQNYAFFPLMPMLIKGIHYICPIDYYILGSIVNTILLGFACYYFYKYIILTRNNSKIGMCAIILLAFGPYSWYCSALLTESLFMFLLALSLCFLQQKKYIHMGISAMLLSATRNTGVFFVFVVLIHSVKEYIKTLSSNQKHKIIGYFKFLFDNEQIILGVCLIPLGFVSFVIYLHFKVGDGLAFMHVQYGWRKKVFRGFFTSLIDCAKLYPVLFIIVIGSILMCGFLIYEKRTEEAILPLATLIAGGVFEFNSQQRYMFSSLLISLAFLDLIFISNKKSLKITRISVLSYLSISEIVLSVYWLQSIRLTCIV